MSDTALPSAMAPLTLGAPTAGTDTSAIGFDPRLLLSAVGASSPSKTATSQESIAAATDQAPSEADKLRAQAAQSVGGAGQQFTQALAQPAPQARSVRYSPLETAIAAALGGYLNSQSPYSSEGTKALLAYAGSKQSQAEQDYQNEVARHTATLQAAQQGYRMAQDQAAPLFQQANSLDADADSTLRAGQERNFQAQQADPERAHRRFLTDQDGDAASRLSQQKVLQQKLVDVLAQTGPGRAMLAAQAGAALGRSADEIIQMARVAALEPPRSVSARMKAHLEWEPATRPAIPKPPQPLPPTGSGLPPAQP